MELARVRERSVGEHGLRYHAGEGKHGQAAVGDLLELHVRLKHNKQQRTGKDEQARVGEGGSREQKLACTFKPGPKRTLLLKNIQNSPVMQQNIR